MTTPEPSDERVIKSHVWHGGECFFVSTIERTSSAAANPCRYNETLVWRFDWAKNERGELVLQGEDSAGSIKRHIELCQSLHTFGIIPETR